MGSLFSCCRRRRTQRREREPLLPKHQDDGSQVRLERSQRMVHKATDAVAALNAGKLPSQDQLSKCLQAILRSGIFAETRNASTDGPLSEGSLKVTDDSRAVIEALLQIGLEKNYDDKIQDFLDQCSHLDPEAMHADIVVETSHPADINAVVACLPSKDEAQDDARILLRSLQILSRLLLTSSTFRLILSDLFTSAREVIADIAANVGRAAVRIEDAVETVEGVVRPRASSTPGQTGIAGRQMAKAGKDAGDDIKHLEDDIWEVLESTAEQGPDQLQGAIITRVQEAILKAHSHPAYRQALQAGMSLLRKYADRLSAASSAMASAVAHGSGVVPTLTPLVWTDDPHLSHAMDDFSSLLSRFSSGYSINKILDSLYTVVWDIVNIPAGASELDQDSLQKLKAFCADVGSWFELALKDPAYAASPAGRTQISNLYDRTRSFVRNATHSDPNSAPSWLRDVHTLVNEVETFSSNFGSDRTSQKLLTALDNLASSSSIFFGAFGSTTANQLARLPHLTSRKTQELKSQAHKDMLTWFLPRLLRAVRVIPMPRVEYLDESFEAIIHPLLIASSLGSSLTPDHIQFQTFNEVELDFTATEETNHTPSVAGMLDAVGLAHTRQEQPRMRSLTRVKVRVDGIRLSVEDVGYYARYKGLFGLGYEDKGLATLDIGSQDSARRAVAGSGGISVEVELEVDTEQFARPNDMAVSAPLFTVRDVHFTIPKLHFTLRKTKHYVLNTLFQPLAGPIVRTLLGYYLRRQIWEVLEVLARLGGNVQDEVEKMKAQQDGTTAREEGYHHGLENYLTATLHALGGGSSGSVTQDDSSDNLNGERHQPDEAPEFSLSVQADTDVTLQGVVRTTVTHTHPSSSSVQDDTTTSVLAIGIGPQILPGKSGPGDIDGQDYGIRDVAHEVQGALNDIMTTGEEIVDEARRGISEADTEVCGAAMKSRQKAKIERSRKGWRSDAFDLDDWFL